MRVRQVRCGTSSLFGVLCALAIAPSGWAAPAQSRKRTVEPPAPPAASATAVAPARATALAPAPTSTVVRAPVSATDTAANPSASAVATAPTPKVADPKLNVGATLILY